MKKNCFFAFFLFLSLLLLTSIAEYANATAVADFEFKVFWNTLTIKDSSGATISPPINWEYRGLNSEAWINGPNPGNPGYVYSQSPWVSTDLTHSLGNNTAALSSDLSNNSPGTLVTRTISSSSGSGDNSGWINGNNHRGIMYDLVGLSGNYTFSVDYALLIKLNRQDTTLEDASAGGGLYFYLEDNVNTPDQRISMAPLLFQANFAPNALVYNFSYSGNASFTVTLPQSWNGTDYWLEAHVNQSSSTSSTYTPGGTPVPEPSTMLLLGSGLIGLAGYGRKKFSSKR